MAYKHLNTKNPRVKKLNGIMTKIAMFAVSETFLEEPEIHKLLAEAISKLEEAATQCIRNDDARNTSGSPIMPGHPAGN